MAAVSLDAPLGRMDARARRGCEHDDHAAEPAVVFEELCHPTARPSSTALRGIRDVPETAGPGRCASTQNKRNDASVRAMRENAMCAPESAAKAAASPPAPLPKVRRASQATAGMVSVPETIETRIADRSPTPEHEIR